MPRTGFYSGSFDPVTLGHADVIRRACRLVDRLVIGVGVNPAKAPMFTAEERVAMLRAETNDLAAGTATAIAIVTFEGLAVAAARSHEASVIVRGVRDATDLDYEMRMAGMNGAMAPDIETVFVAAGPGVRHMSASLVRDILTMGGDVSPFVSPAIAHRIASLSREAR